VRIRLGVVDLPEPGRAFKRRREAVERSHQNGPAGSPCSKSWSRPDLIVAIKLRLSGCNECAPDAEDTIGGLLASDLRTCAKRELWEEARRLAYPCCTTGLARRSAM
jgi:hypothetical protein